MIALLLAATSKIGVDVSSAVDESTWKCLRSPGGQGPVEFAVVRVYRSTGTVDPSGAATIKAARAAGIQSVDGYVFPCVTCAASPGAQVRAAVDALDAAGATIGMLWLDIERYEWSTNYSANAAFVTAMVDECHSLSLSCGIYGGKNSWVAIFGSASAYTYPAQQGLPLWYAHYDNSPSFSDWTAYGGWSAPSIKQYLGDETSCGASIDYNWVPDSLAEQHASARQLQDEPFYDLYCPLGHSERAPCGLVAFVAQCTVSFFNVVIALVTVGHRLYQACCTAKRVDEAASASAGGSSWWKRLVLVVGTGSLACVYYFAGSSGHGRQSRASRRRRRARRARSSARRGWSCVCSSSSPSIWTSARRGRRCPSGSRSTRSSRAASTGTAATRCTPTSCGRCPASRSRCSAGRSRSRGWC